MLCVLALALYLVFEADPSVVPRWRGGIIAALTYSANWFEVFSGVSYFEQFQDPSPLYHTWSLAIEEQFYLVVPFVVLGVLLRGRTAGLRTMLVIGVVGALASAAWMAALYDGGDPTRVYYGTDTRAQGLLVGIALAAAVRLWGPVRTAAGRRATQVVGYAGFAYIVWAVFTLDQNKSWLFDRGGFLALTIAAAGIVFATATGLAGPLHWLLDLAPTRYLGRITYGVYLYHWPIFLIVITPRRLASSPWWVLAGVALTLAVATVSYELIERPIVQRRVPLVNRPLRPLFTGTAMAFVVAIVAVSVAVVDDESPATATDVGTELPPPPDTTDPAAEPGGEAPRRPLRVMIVGDSVMLQIGGALNDYSKQHPDELVVFNHARLGCPIARGGKIRVHDGTTPDVLPQCNKWAEPAPVDQLGDADVYSFPTALEAFQPDIVLSQVTAWDVHDRRIPEHGFPDWTNVGDPAFDEYAAAEYREATELLTSTGARMVWLLAAHQDRPLAPMTDPVRIDRLNELVASSVRDLPNVSIVDYSAWLGPVGSDVDRRRREDGLHLSETGRAEIIPWLTTEVLGIGGASGPTE